LIVCTITYLQNPRQWLLRENEKKLARFFNFMFHYIYHIISQNYSKFGDFVDHIYPIDITDTAKSASYLDLHPAGPAHATVHTC
jgi:hypothetical protein